VVVRDRSGVQIRYWTLQPITDETRNVFDLTANDDGTATTWTDRGVYRGCV
jgi:hypothetical protein